MHRYIIPRNHYKGGVSEYDHAQSEIKAAYQKAFGVSWWHTLFGLTSLQFADQTYRRVNLDKMAEILEIDRADNEEYVAEDFDCDDYAFALMGAFHRDLETAAMPIFVTWVATPSGGHALISFYYEGEVVMIEPQNDEVFSVPREWTLKLLCG